MIEEKELVVRKSSMYGTIFWMVLDNVVPFVCSKQFWQNNCDKIHAFYWERLLNTLRTLLPYAVDTVIPFIFQIFYRRLKSTTLKAITMPLNNGMMTIKVFLMNAKCLQLNQNLYHRIKTF
jgi:hypothetical protein